MEARGEVIGGGSAIQEALFLRLWFVDFDSKRICLRTMRPTENGHAPMEPVNRLILPCLRLGQAPSTVS